LGAGMDTFTLLQKYCFTLLSRSLSTALTGSNPNI
jgi:hypothetical protein